MSVGGMAAGTSARPVRPWDAAGVVLLRPPPAGSAMPRVLLGRRAAWLTFMPGVWVVPGGRHDPRDDRMPADWAGMASGVPSTADRLMRRCSRRRAGALLRTALRELWEEAGMLAGTDAPAPPDIRPATPEPAAPGPAAPGPVATGPVATGPGMTTPTTPGADATVWAAYRRAAIRPALDRLDYVVRAVTPADSPVRFDTRFLVAVGARAVPVGPGDGELEDIGWYPLDRLDGLAMAGVTRFVLAESARLWQAGTLGEARPDTATYVYRQGRSRILYT